MENNLREVFKKHKIRYEEFTERTGISKSSLYRYFRTPLEDFKLYQITLLCSVLPIEPEFFGKDNSIYSFKKVKPDQNPLISYSYLEKKKGTKNYSTFLKKYFRTLINQVKSARESIVIIDYTGDNLFAQHNNSEDYEYFTKAYKEFLKAISDFIKKKQKEDEENGTQPRVVFTRILQCPINLMPQLACAGHKLDEALDLSYESMFEQFESLWPDYKDYFKLCYVKTAFRPHSVMIIDNKNIITEYVRYDKELQAKPDMIFTDYKTHNDSKDIAHILIDGYQNDIALVVNDTSKIITRKRAFLGLQSIKKAYNKSFDKTVKKLEKLKEKIAQENDLDLNNTDSLKPKSRKKLNKERAKYLSNIELKKELKELLFFIKERQRITENKLNYFTKRK